MTHNAPASLHAHQTRPGPTLQAPDQCSDFKSLQHCDTLKQVSQLKNCSIDPPESSMAQTTPNTNTATMQDTTTPTKDPKTSTMTIDVETQDYTTMRTCLGGSGLPKVARFRRHMGIKHARCHVAQRREDVCMCSSHAVCTIWSPSEAHQSGALPPPEPVVALATVIGVTPNRCRASCTLQAAPLEGHEPLPSYG